MKISKQIIEKMLKIKIEGKLNNENSSKLENELQDLNDIEKIIFDLEKLEYISSSGLRTILSCRKQVEDTTIINCCPEVYEIFELTGFNNIINIETSNKSLENIIEENRVAKK